MITHFVFMTDDAELFSMYYTTRPISSAVIVREVD